MVEGGRSEYNTPYMSESRTLLGWLSMFPGLYFIFYSQVSCPCPTENTLNESSTFQAKLELVIAIYNIETGNLKLKQGQDNAP